MVKYKTGDALKQGIALLNENKIENAGLDARVLLCHVLNCDSLYLTLHRDEELDESDGQMFFSFIERRIKREPISYITGKKEFMSMIFTVNPSVLIPRPDTEILVERVISELKAVTNPCIIDMCTGSGAIAVSLARYLEGSRVSALDISEEALGIARKNAFDNGVCVEFDIHDVLTPFDAVMADAVVSNPPYISTEDMKQLDSDVSDYEPHLALAGGDDGLVFYRAIVANISSCLKKGGLLAFEVGMGQADDVKKIMEPLFDNISVDCDLAGIERVVYGFLK